MSWGGRVGYYGASDAAGRGIPTNRQRLPTGFLVAGSVAVVTLTLCAGGFGGPGPVAFARPLLQPMTRATYAPHALRSSATPPPPSSRSSAAGPAAGPQTADEDQRRAPAFVALPGPAAWGSLAAAAAAAGAVCRWARDRFARSTRGTGLPTWAVAAVAEGESVHRVAEGPAQDMTVAAFYKFVLLSDFQELRPRLQTFCDERGIYGTILLAKEGINSTVAGPPEAVEALLAHLRADPRLADLEAKYSEADARPFRRMKVRVKREIVTMGVEDVDPRRGAEHVDPRQWNALLQDPEAFVIDVRNAYEYRIGAFEAAVDPQTKHFREFPKYVESIPEAKKKKVLMYCTGGIRCEKAGAYMKQQGFEQVYQLKGGILKYLETVPETESRWRGQCFVFDRRVAVKHGLEPGDYSMCFACGEPMAEGDEASPLFERGVSCPRCHDAFSAYDKERFRERVRQMDLAKARLDRGEVPKSSTAFSSKLWSILPSPQ